MRVWCMTSTDVRQIMTTYYRYMHTGLQLPSLYRIRLPCRVRHDSTLLNSTERVHIYSSSWHHHKISQYAIRKWLEFLRRLLDVTDDT